MTPTERLEQLFSLAGTSLGDRAAAGVHQARIDAVCQSPGNRACVRLLMACLCCEIGISQAVAEAASETFVDAP